MSLAALLLFQAVLGIVFATLVLRADARRVDNRIFASIGLIDGLMTLYRAIRVIDGHSLTDFDSLRVCTGISVVLAWMSLELACSFPFNKPMAQRWRVPGLLFSAASLAYFYVASDSNTAGLILSWAYFLPMFTTMLVNVRRNLGQMRGDRTGNYLVAGAIAFRWLSAMSVFLISRRISPAAFAATMSFDATAASLASYLVIGYAVLRGHLFSVRGVLAMVLVTEGLSLGVVAMTAVAVEAAFAVAPGPVALRVLLVGAAFVPLGLVALAVRVRGRLEDAVLPRRALRRDAVARVRWNETHSDVLLANVRRALGRVTHGGRVRFLVTLGSGDGDFAADGRLPPALERVLAGSKSGFVRRGQTPGLDADAARELETLGTDLLVSASAGGRLLGALSITAGNLDRESLHAARELADRLALTLENVRLFGELEENKRLAALGAFAAAVAHDLRTPMTSVQMNLQILQKKARAFLDADDMEHFDIALEELQRMAGHTSDLLDYAKPVQLHATSVDLREVAGDAARGVAPIFAERKVALERDDAAGVPGVRADATRMRQVVENLLDNAARASRAGGVVTMRTRSDGNGRIALDVADHGSGIASADLPRLFEPFFTTRPDGTGLGLAICQKLVKAHDGEIQVRSTPGEGSTFTVLLPAG